MGGKCSRALCSVFIFSFILIVSVLIWKLTQPGGTNMFCTSSGSAAARASPVNPKDGTYQTGNGRQTTTRNITSEPAETSFGATDEGESAEDKESPFQYEDQSDYWSSIAQSTGDEYKQQVLSNANSNPYQLSAHNEPRFFKTTGTKNPLLTLHEGTCGNGGLRRTDPTMVVHWNDSEAHAYASTLNED